MIGRRQAWKKLTCRELQTVHLHVRVAYISLLYCAVWRFSLDSSPLATESEPRSLVQSIIVRRALVLCSYAPAEASRNVRTASRPPLWPACVSPRCLLAHRYTCAATRVVRPEWWAERSSASDRLTRWRVLHARELCEPPSLRSSACLSHMPSVTRLDSLNCH